MDAIAIQDRLEARCAYLLLAGAAAHLLAIGASANQFVKLDYNLTLNNRGRDSVFFELFDDKPLTVANFLKYVTNTGVEHGSYDGSIMHRLSRNFVLQGGGYYSKPINTPTAPYVALDPTGIIDFDGNANTSNLTVAGEYSVGATRSNLTGTVSMALCRPEHRNKPMVCESSRQHIFR